MKIDNFSNNHLESLEKLYRNVYGSNYKRKLEAFCWLQFHNPFRDVDQNYVVLQVKGEIAAYWGKMPVKFYHYGKPFVTLFSQEALVDPKFRRQGLAKKLMEEVNKSEKFILSMWHNEKVLPILEKYGWRRIGYFRPLKKIFRFDNILPKRIQSKVLKNSLVFVLNRIIRITHRKKEGKSRYKTKTIERFGEEFDIFFGDVAPKMGILSDRTASTLNWKYIDIPYKEYEAIAVTEDNKPCGYLILRIDHQEDLIKKGLIVDFLINPNRIDALRPLLAKADEIFIKNNVDFSVCLVQPENYRMVFKKMGYFSGRKKEVDTLLGYNFSDSPNLEKISNIENWHLSYGDSDGDLW